MKKRVIYLQEETYSCGACCIQSIVSHYGGYVPLETVLDDTSTTQTGTNAYEIVMALRKYGFSSYGKKIPLSDIEKSELPLIAHVVKNGLEHFLVVYEIDEFTVSTMDPECGEKRYSKEEFNKISDEKFIFMNKEGEIPKYKPSSTLLKSLLNIFNMNKATLVVISLLCLVCLILNLIGSFQFKFLEMFEYPLKITILCIIVKISFFIISIIKDFLIIRLSAKMDRHLNTRFIEHIFYLPRRFLLRKKTGELVKKINDVSFIKDLVIRLSIINGIDILLIVVSLVIIMKMSSKLALIYLGITLIVILLTILLNKRVYKRNRANLNIYDEYTGNLIESVGGIESIKNLNKERYFLGKIYKSYDRYIEDKRKIDIYFSFVENMKSFILNTGLLIVNLIGFMSLDETFTMYDLITLQSLFSLFISSIESILNTHYHLSTGRAMYKRCSELLDIEKEKEDKKKVSLPFKIILVDGLNYSYDGVHPNVTDMKTSIKRGQKVLLRGPSGVGKSTFVKCICGMLEDYSGHITINGVDIKEISKSELRNIVVYVSQEEKLFSDTIKENVTLGDYEEERFEKISKLCLLDEVFSKRIEGADSTVLEGGSNLSGGERARIILARAIYKRPSVLIVDETLSSVSEKMEDEIIRNLLDIKNLTVIYITHRKKEHLFKNIIELERKE